MEIDKIPLLRNAKDWLKGKTRLLFLNNKQIEISDLMNHSVKAIMPPGWRNYNKI